MKKEENYFKAAADVHGRDFMIPERYLEKLYAGVLGMNSGIRLGAPLEPLEWTAERIQQVHGDIKGYVKDYKTFSADDDANGPIFFIRSLYDEAKDKEIEAEDVGKTWMNYCREGIGMIWWGGEDISTEHRAFTNLQKGIKAPQSGSAKVNGVVMAEQIGGQIFIDSWGLIFPADIEKAAYYAEVAASVSHDLNGLYGARFMAACISNAFSAQSINEVLQTGLSMIPSDSTYAKMVRAVTNFHQKNPANFRLCRQYLEEFWGYDKYPGICHIIPNAAVCVLALLYGEGNFSKTIEIAVMCGWDTDCNAGTVGTITGVLTGLEGIPEHYRKPINDSIVASSVSGYLNIVDLPTFTQELALLGYRMAGLEPPEEVLESIKEGDVFFNFHLPGSTHGFKTDNPFKAFLRHNKHVGEGSLEVIFDRMVEGDVSKVFYKPFYRRQDFNDEKYKPTFAPKAYSGQTVSVDFFLDQWQGSGLVVTPYVRITDNQECLYLTKCELNNQAWNHVDFQIPDTAGSLIDEVGYKIESPSNLTCRAIGALYVDNFHIKGQVDYSIAFSKQFEEFGSLTPFAHNKGNWKLDGQTMKYSSSEDCSSYTGNYYTKDAVIEAVITPIVGVSHKLIFRAEGIQRQYLIGFDGSHQVSLIKKDFGYERLITVPFEWKHHQAYVYKVEYHENKICFFIDDEKLIEYNDSRFSKGMFGFGCLEKGEAVISSFKIKEVG